MGCASSRTEKRNADLDDYNTLDIAFMGGDGRQLDKELCPVDKVFLNWAIDRSNLGNGFAKETVELLSITKYSELEDKAEMNARRYLKDII